MQPHKTLYIIGNGFDLHHNIPSAYKHFGDYLRDNHYKTYTHLLEYLHADDGDFWSHFEQNLAHFDSDLLLEIASDFLVGYGAEDWSDAYHHDYQYEIDQVVSNLSCNLLQCFKNWVVTLPIPAQSDCKDNTLYLDKNALFLTFNYTSTLEDLYHISENNILHIHGKATDEKLILGHGWNEHETEVDVDADPEDCDTRIQEGDNIIKEYFTKTFKPTEAIISINQKYFKTLSGLEQIIILGHSLGDVDILYFFEIIKFIETTKVQWTISYYNDARPIQKQFKKLGISEQLVSFIKLTEYCSRIN